jgi:hypothetical protein
MVAGSLFAFGLLVWGTFNVVDLLAHGRSTEVTTHEPVGSVVVDTEVGSVEVRAADVAEITATARVGEGLRATAVSRQAAADRLVLRSSCPNVGGAWCSVDWIVVVPAGTAVSARSEHGRTEVSGRFESVVLRSDDGSVRFDGAARSIDATSDNGDVVVNAVDAPDRVRASSDNGNVRIAVPDIDDGYRVDVASGDGSTDVGVRTDPNASRTIDARSDDGNVTVAAAP